MTNPKRYHSLLLMAIPIGLVVGFAVLVFFYLMRIGIFGLWEWLPGLWGLQEATRNPWYILGLTVLGGLLVGLCNRYLRSEEEIDLLKEIRKEGRINTKKVPGTLITAYVSLIFGGSVGPEAPLMDLGAGLGSFISNRMKHGSEKARSVTFAGLSAVFGAFFSSPFGSAFLALELPNADFRSYRLLFPGIIATTITYCLFIALVGTTMGGEYVFPPYPGVQFLYLMYGVPLGLAGAFVGIFFIFCFRELHYVMRPLARYPVLRGVLGGVVLGLVTMNFPLALFTGEHELQTLIDTGLGLGAGLLLLLGLAKIIVTCFCFATGFVGGRIFPVFFAGGAIGMAIHVLVPAVPLTVAMLCVMASMAVTTMKIPIAVVLIVSAIIQPGLEPILSIAVIVSYVLTMNIALMPKDVEKQRSIFVRGVRD